MENQLILVADNDTKNLEILQENLEASGFLVTTASNGKSAWEEIIKTKPKLLLTEINLPDVSGFQLIEKMQNDPETANIPVIFLTKQRDVQQRLRAFELGVKDYLVKPLHVKEVIAHIRMILRRLKRFDADAGDLQNQFSGKLEQLNLADLIESFGVERKTGILTLSNGRCSGQVFFRDGAVINARLGDFKMEQALYQMFPWKKGFFKMIFQEVDVAEEISISNLGLLLQGLKRMEMREKLIKQLPSPNATFVTTPVFRQLLQKKKLDNGVNEFTRLLDGKHTIEQIIDESKLEDLVVLKRLVRLYKQGFITSKTAEKAAELPKPEAVLADSESEFSQQLSKYPPLKPQELEKEVHPSNGKDRHHKDEEPIFPGIEQESPPKTHDFEGIKEQTPEPTLQLRREPKKSIEHEREKPEQEKEQIPHSSIDTEKSLFEEVFMEDENRSAQAKQSDESETDADISQINLSEPDLEERRKTEDSILKDKNLEDYIFEVTPRRTEHDLEEEIKPLISEIEQNSQQKEAATSREKSDKIEEIPQKEDPPAPDETETDISAGQETFVDEELLRQAALARRELKTPPEKEQKEDEVITPEAEKREKVYRKGLTGDKVVLISVDEDCKDSVMDILTHDNFKTVQVPNMPDFSIDVGKVKLDQEKEVKLISVPIEKQLNTFLESIVDSTLGCLFTFDCSRAETWEYTGYLIKSVSDKLSAPFAVLVMNSDEQESMTLEVIRYKLALSPDDLLLPCDETDENCVNELIAIMHNFIYADQDQPG